MADTQKAALQRPRQPQAGCDRVVAIGGVERLGGRVDGAASAADRRVVHFDRRRQTGSAVDRWIKVVEPAVGSTLERIPIHVVKAVTVRLFLPHGIAGTAEDEVAPRQLLQVVAATVAVLLAAATGPFPLRLRRQVVTMSALFFQRAQPLDRKSTRLNSSHVKISYAVFCLKKK